jgi:hypothetical protein
MGNESTGFPFLGGTEKSHYIGVYQRDFVEV